MSVCIKVIIVTMGICFLFSVLMGRATATQDIGASERILGGQNVTPHDYPMVVAITNSRDDIYCTGSLLNAHWVITSATCFLTVEDYSNELIFIAGAHEIFNPTGTEQRAKGIKFVPHWRFTKEQQRHNIALVKIHPPFRLNRYVTPTNLPTCNTETDVIGRHDLNVTGVISGFGRAGSNLDNGPIIPILKQRPVILYSMEKCVEFLGNDILSDSIVCGSGIPCAGDDGLPLFIRDKNGRLIQIGMGKRRRQCNAPHPYIRISKYLDWFNAVLNGECEVVTYVPCSRPRDCQGENECCDEHPSEIIDSDVILRGYCRHRKYARKCRP